MEITPANSTRVRPSRFDSSGSSKKPRLEKAIADRT